MIVVTCPERHNSEKRYVFRVLFEVLFSVPHRIEFSATRTDYLITLPNACRLRLSDAFFGNYDDLAYLNPAAIPQSVETMRIANEEQMPVIFGDGSYERSQEEIRVGVDLVAGAFFMLTRWEEYVSPEKDRFGRFAGADSLAFRAGFLGIPVVNVYAELIRDLCRTLGYDGFVQNTSYEIIPTHDVDNLDYHVNLRSLIGDVLKRRDVSRAIARLRGSRGQPFRTFSWLMDLSERASAQSRFYFMSAPPGENQTGYDVSRIRGDVDDIANRGHVVGFHPGFATYLDSAKWGEELNTLRERTDKSIVEGRQHFLQFDVPRTYRIWDDHRMRVDSSMGYPDREGFRCGTGCEFPVFDFVKRKELSLRERPLTLMDVTLKNYRNMTADEALEVLDRYRDLAKRYRMPLTILFHNNSFTDFDWPGFARIYADFLGS
jgi:hypothetical protein